jgi:hypothetical protein
LSAIRLLRRVSPWGSRIEGKTWNSRFWSQNGVVSQCAAVFEDTATSNDHILTDVNIRTNNGSLYDGSFPDENIFPNLEWEKGNPAQLHKHSIVNQTGK